MDNEVQSEYRARVQGAATWVLVGKKNLATEALELANLFHLELATVKADIDAIVQAEHRRKAESLKHRGRGKRRRSKRLGVHVQESKSSGNNNKGEM